MIIHPHVLEPNDAGIEEPIIKFLWKLASQLLVEHAINKT